MAAGTGSGRPFFTRGYVTITTLVTPEDPQALAEWCTALEDGLARYGNDEPRAVPEDGTPVVGFDLTTHQGHFMGNGHNRLMLYTDANGTAWVRAVGTWDPDAVAHRARPTRWPARRPARLLGAGRTTSRRVLACTSSPCGSPA